MPTASMATSTPLPPVSAITFATAFPSPLFTTWVAPSFFATSRRLSSRSTMMSSAGEDRSSPATTTTPTTRPSVIAGTRTRT